MSLLQYNNCKYNSAFKTLPSSKIIAKATSNSKNSLFSILKKRYSNKNNMGTASLNIYVDEAFNSLCKCYSSEMIDNMAKVKMFSNITEDEETVYSDSFLHRINELLVKLGNNQPEIFPSSSGKIEFDFGKSSNRLIVFLSDDNMTLIKSTSNGKPQIIARKVKIDSNILLNEISEL